MPLFYFILLFFEYFCLKFFRSFYSSIILFTVLCFFLLIAKWISHCSSVTSRVQLFATPWTAALQASLSLTISQSLLKVMSIESVMPSNHLILSFPFSSCLQSFPGSGFFSNESALHIRWSKYLSFSISPSNEYSGLISFRIDWFDLLPVSRAISRTSLKALILWCSAFFIVQLSHLYMSKFAKISLK